MRSSSAPVSRKEAELLDRDEIIHTFFREVRPAATPSAEEGKLCNLGAAALTMPAARFSPFLAARPLCFATIQECQREFAVSLVAAGRRAMALTDLSSCLLIAGPAETKISSRSDAPELQITRWWWSDRWPFPLKAATSASPLSGISDKRGLHPPGPVG